MSVRIHVDPAHHRATLRVSGAVNAAKLMHAVEALYREPEWQPGYDVVWDCRAIRELLLDKGDLSSIAEHTAGLHAQSGEGRRALVTTRDLDHMVAKLIVARIRGDGRRRQVFHTMQAALAWLETPGEGA